MDQREFMFLEPLFKEQSWIESVNYSEGSPDVDYNLNEFRNTWFSKKQSRCLFQCYSEHFKTPPLPEDISWLSVQPFHLMDTPIIIARSPRFRNESFPWNVVEKTHRGQIGFVGLPEEHKAWSMVFGKVKYLPVMNALQLARYIAGCRLFIGNQSFPMSLAMALGVPVVQEVFAGSSDCVFHRPQAVYWQGGPYHEPSMKTRYVSTTPNKEGLIELGPQENAFGLGDILTITPLARRLGEKAIMCLPKLISRFAPLFDGLCPVKITDDSPIFPDVGQRFIESKLRQFGFNDFKDRAELPCVKLSETEIAGAKDWLSSLNLSKRPLFVQTRCAKQWESVRSRPDEFFSPIMEILKRTFSLILPSNDWDLRTLAARLHSIGLYFGVNTGDWHIAISVGCRCLVMDSEPCDGYDPGLWRYDTPKVLYSGFDQTNIVERIPWLIDPKLYEERRNS